MSMLELSDSHMAGWFPAEAERWADVILGGSSVGISREAFLSVKSESPS